MVGVGEGLESISVGGGCIVAVILFVVEDECLNCTNVEMIRYQSLYENTVIAKFLIENTLGYCTLTSCLQVTS